MVRGCAQVSGTLQEKRSGDKTTPAYTDPPIENVPDLAIMTRGAMNVLSQNRNGFYVHVGGGAVD
jgi:alkaline phosphatase